MNANTLANLTQKHPHKTHFYSNFNSQVMSFNVFVVVAFAVLSVCVAADNKEMLAIADNTTWSSGSAFLGSVTRCMNWNADPQYSYLDIDLKANVEVHLLLSDSTKMQQLENFVIQNKSLFIQCIRNDATGGHIRLTAVDIVTANGGGSQPDGGDKGNFITKYPYVIAGVGVVLIIVIIALAVFLIQRRADRQAELLQDENFITESGPPRPGNPPQKRAPKQPARPTGGAPAPSQSV